MTQELPQSSSSDRTSFDSKGKYTSNFKTLITFHDLFFTNTDLNKSSSLEFVSACKPFNNRHRH